MREKPLRQPQKRCSWRTTTLRRMREKPLRQPQKRWQNPLLNEERLLRLSRLLVVSCVLWFAESGTTSFWPCTVSNVRLCSHRCSTKPTRLLTTQTPVTATPSAFRKSRQQTRATRGRVTSKRAKCVNPSRLPPIPTCAAISSLEPATRRPTALAPARSRLSLRLL